MRAWYLKRSRRRWVCSVDRLKEIIRKAAASAERRVATVYGGRLIPGSGSGEGRKGDVQTDEELIEVKYTTRGSYSLKEADLAKLVRAGHVAGLDPILNIEFELSNGKAVHYVVVPETNHLRDRALIEGMRSELDWR